LIDLSHTVEHGMITYKGLPAPIICDFLSREDSRKHYAAGTEFNIGKIEMVANTGTYVDSLSPICRWRIVRTALSRWLILRSCPRTKLGTLSIPAFSGISSKQAVLINTDWSRHWGKDQYFEGHTFLTKDAAEFLVEQGAAFVGIDTYNIDDTTDGARPVHTTLLGNQIPICEHMRGLGLLPDRFRFHAAPVKVKRSAHSQSVPTQFWTNK
jgi:kynurenine formamidase